jgi:hypothetical protein
MISPNGEVARGYKMRMKLYQNAGQRDRGHGETQQSNAKIKYLVETV